MVNGLVLPRAVVDDVDLTPARAGRDLLWAAAAAGAVAVIDAGANNGGKSAEVAPENATALSVNDDVVTVVVGVAATAVVEGVVPVIAGAIRWLLTCALFSSGLHRTALSILPLLATATVRVGTAGTVAGADAARTVISLSSFARCKANCRSDSHPVRLGCITNCLAR